MNRLLKNFRKDSKIVDVAGYTPTQAWNTDESGLFWKRIPNRTYVVKAYKRAEWNLKQNSHFLLMFLDILRCLEVKIEDRNFPIEKASWSPALYPKNFGFEDIPKESFIVMVTNSSQWIDSSACYKHSSRHCLRYSEKCIAVLHI
ncbi:hypothetical protein CDAR_474971 [Caerostris darwini]|uniref:PiggyBac transposable element-derived protein domain-containing protein n=1 Tax=Caerostris darwini TaxID=1538125 RepID=A0AAV4QQM8_9ARAC|nr:hypothetical protein CDAR_474971 [Caerostris darwini]